MNYFEIFGLKPAFHLDKTLLNEAYKKEIWNSHPDRNASTDSLERTGLLNTGLKILSDDDKRLRYLLELHGVAVEGSGAKLPPDFLMQMMDINEQLDEVETNFDAFVVENISHDIDMEEQHIRSEINRSAREFEESQSESMLAMLAQNYFKLKYILRLKERIANFAAL